LHHSGATASPRILPTGVTVYDLTRADSCFACAFIFEHGDIRHGVVAISTEHNSPRTQSHLLNCIRASAAL
jgi:hypothetical protein